MSQKIGYQDGIAGLVNFLKKFPLVKYRPVGDRPLALEQWTWLEKIERMLRILKDDHDAAITTPIPNPPPTPESPPTPTYKKVAPITVREEGGSDQMVCIWAGAPGDLSRLQPGVVRLPSGEFTDESGAKYAADGDGRENSGVRSKVNDPRLVGARSMDGRSACECPPVGDPTKNTGSWTV